MSHTLGEGLFESYCRTISTDKDTLVLQLMKYYVTTNSTNGLPLELGDSNVGKLQTY